MLTVLLLPPSPGGGSHKLSLRWMSPLTAQVKREKGRCNEERIEDGERLQGYRQMRMIFRRCIIFLQFIALTFVRTQAILYYVLGVAPTAMWCYAKLLYFTEDLLDMTLMCSLLMWRSKARRETLTHTLYIKWKENKKKYAMYGICM